MRINWIENFGILMLFLISTSANAIANGGELRSAQAHEVALLKSHAGTIRIPIQSWKTLRDARIVKQDLDYSCSAASLATLLNEFYGQSVTEEALLKVMDKGDLRASFEDMQRALPPFTSN